MIQADKVRDILLQELVKAQARNPNYSMRAYSQKIGLAQSAISEILSGKRPITKKNAKKILVGLNKDPEEVFQLLGSSEDSSTPKYTPVDIDAFRVIADWHNYAILSLAETKDFQSSPQWIANRLGISEKVANESIHKLLRLKMLQRNERSGELTVTGQQFEAISTMASSALKEANRQNIDLITDALEKTPVAERDFTAITLCFDPSRINDARKMIKNFRRNFNKVMESGHKKEVYKLCVQLFPLSKRGLL